MTCHGIICSIFELGGIIKHLMKLTTGRKNGPTGNSEFCFPRTLRVSGKQNSLFPLGPVIKCLLIGTSLVCHNLSQN